ncbi:MAG: thermonuclease family protein [Nitrospiraceae bacterium]
MESRRGLVAALFTLWLAGSAMAGGFTGQVVGVLDGDTIAVLHNQHAARIRLSGMDGPEKGTINLRAVGLRPKV